jgi:hypothetical protein
MKKNHYLYHVLKSFDRRYDEEEDESLKSLSSNFVVVGEEEQEEVIEITSLRRDDTASIVTPSSSANNITDIASDNINLKKEDYSSFGSTCITAVENEKGVYFLHSKSRREYCSSMWY